jgi:hypothetical protein
VTAVALVLALGAGCAGSTGAAVARKKPKPAAVVPPWVRQQATGFVDRTGAPVLLRGVNARSLDPAEYRQAVALHANFVRLPVYWSRIEPDAPSGGRHFYSQTELGQIDAEVAFLRAHRINVLIDFHQYYWSPYFGARPGIVPLGLPAWLYQGSQYAPTAPGRFKAIADFYSDPKLDKAYQTFVTMMVQRYSMYPNVVGYEILNEPPNGTLPQTKDGTATLLRWEGGVANLIRGLDPYRTVFFMTRGAGGLGLKSANLAPFGSLTRLALDVHDYWAGTTSAVYTGDGENWAQPLGPNQTLRQQNYTGTIDSQRAYLATAIARTRAWNIPLVVGEWGAPRTVPTILDYQSQMLSLFAENNLSWARWNMARNAPLGLLNADGSLSPVAQQIAQALGGGSTAPPPAG